MVTMTVPDGRDAAEWVYVVDDDLSVREALSSLIRSIGLPVETYPSAAAFLAAPRRASVACLILDVRMPDVNGMELQMQRLVERFVETNQVALVGRMEGDGMPVKSEAFVRVTLA